MVEDAVGEGDAERVRLSPRALRTVIIPRPEDGDVVAAEDVDVEVEENARGEVPKKKDNQFVE